MLGARGGVPVCAVWLRGVGRALLGKHRADAPARLRSRTRLARADHQVEHSRRFVVGGWSFAMRFMIGRSLLLLV